MDFGNGGLNQEYVWSWAAGESNENGLLKNEEAFLK
jgi:hypothetical protein